MKKHCWNCKYWRASKARYVTNFVNECSQLFAYPGICVYERIGEKRKEALIRTGSEWVCGFHKESKAKMKQEPPPIPNYYNQAFKDHIITERTGKP